MPKRKKGGYDRIRLKIKRLKRKLKSRRTRFWSPDLNYSDNAELSDTSSSCSPLNNQDQDQPPPALPADKAPVQLEMESEPDPITNENSADPSTSVVPEQRDPVVPEQRVPVVLKQRDPVVPEQKDPVGPEQRDPVVPEQRDPVVPELRDPVIPEQRDPVGPEQRDPVVPEQRDSLVPEQRDPVVPELRDPVISEQRDPVGPEQRDPVVPEQRVPVVLEQRDPVVPEQRDPVVPEQRDPVVPEEREPVVLEQRDPEIHSEDLVLDSELLDILGIGPTTHKKYGKNIQNDLSIKFQHWTMTGISKELHKELKEKYLTPENAKLIDAPELNAEIKALISDVIIKRDEACERKQKQIALAITALGESITLILSAKERNITLLKLLLDSARIVCDYQHAISVTRRNYILKALKNDVRNQLENTKIDKFLFGEDLSEIIMSEKTVNKCKTPAPKSPNKKVPHSTANLPRSLNWKNPVRTCKPSDPPRVKKPATITKPRQSTSSSKQSQQRPNYRHSRTLQSNALQDYPGATDIIREAMIRRGVPRSSIDAVLNSLLEKPCKEFEGCYKKWFIYCNENELNWYEVSISNMINFLTNAYNDGARYRTLILYRAALSYITEENVYKNEDIKRFFKGVLLRSIPSHPTLNDTCDTSLVLNYLAKWYPNEDLSLEKITKKLITLLALVTPYTMQTMSKINLNNIHRSVKEIKIKIPIKTCKGKSGPSETILIIPYFDKKPEICPGKTLLAYIELSEGFRTNTDTLFISYKRPHKSIGAISLSRYVKDTLSLCGVDTSRFTLHNTRIAATDAQALGVYMNKIRDTAD